MGNLRMSEWQTIPISLSELCINTTLRCGQSFRWRKSGPDEWSCALNGRILSLRQDSSQLHYRAIFPAAANDVSRIRAPARSPHSSAFVSVLPPEDTYHFLHRYLNLKPDLLKLYAEWSAADANFRRLAPNFKGIRILRQDPWEALCGFICSSNNNISRISQMMHKLCLHYGPLVGHLEHQVAHENGIGESKGGQKNAADSEATEQVQYHDFPPPEVLIGPGVEARLRDLGFGYRAKYIYQTACNIVNNKGGLQWLESFVNPEASLERSGVEVYAGELPAGGRQGYRLAHEALLELQGVGPKVADCVCLMGLGWLEAVPVDTHVWQIAQRDYNFRSKGAGKAGVSTLTKATYDAVGDKFRALWGKEAGWAHSVLFTADLRSFAPQKEPLVATLKRKLGIEVKKEEDDGSPVKPAKATKVKHETVPSKRLLLQTLGKPANAGVQEHESELEGADMMSRIKRRRRK